VVKPAPDDPYVATINGGTARGPLVGGCLALIVALIGTPWELDLRGAVFFFEDVGEQPYGIDRMLTQLAMAGKLDGVAGIVIGEHADCEPRGPSNSLGLEQVWDDVLKPLGVPTIYHLPIGHGRHHATLPIGALAELDADRKQLRIVEPGVV
jgi:muramoyltetrapeptide carboxypeptidase